MGKSKKKQTKHPLSGSTLENLKRLERLYGPMERRGSILGSILGKSPFTLFEKLYFHPKAQSVEFQPPIFILGHWRSGTTHLYNILAKAPRFQFVDPFQAGLPWDFLTLTKLFRPLLIKNLPKGRYIDGVAVTPDSPQEDEFALANMMPFSFLHGLYFPENFFNTFNKGLFFEDVGKKEVQDWQEKLKLFYGKLQLAGPGKTILIKNPVYTARVKLLREIFPDSKFIHIRRNPYKIFFSMRNFYNKLLNELALQPYDFPDLDDHILSVYVRMQEALERDAASLPKDRFVDIEFESLQKNPLAALKSIYGALNLKGFETDKGFYEDYLRTISEYKKNVYEFKEGDLNKVETHWQKYIKAGGYGRP